MILSSVNTDMSVVDVPEPVDHTVHPNGFYPL